MAVPSPQPITVELSAYQGEPSSTNRTVASYVSPGLSASFAVVANVVIATSATDTAIDLSDLFPAVTAPVGIFVQEVTEVGLGFSVGTDTGTKAAVRALGFWAFMADGSGLPTLYFDGPSSGDVQIQIGVLGS